MIYVVVNCYCPDGVDVEEVFLSRDLAKNYIKECNKKYPERHYEIVERKMWAKVYVVLHENSWDQVSDFHNVFTTKKLAQGYIDERVFDEHEKQYWLIKEMNLIES